MAGAPDPAPAPVALSAEDLQFAPADAEALVVFRPAALTGSTGFEKAWSGLSEVQRRTLESIRESFDLAPETVELVAIAFSDLRLAERFSHADRKAYLERRVEETRSNTQRKRLERTLERLIEPPPPGVLARIRLREVASLEALLEKISEKESIENGGRPYVRFGLPPVLRPSFRGQLAAAQLDATDILVGTESIVAQALGGEAGRPLAELGLNEVDLDQELIASLFPGAESKQALKAWIAYRFRPRDGEPPRFDAAELNRIDQLTSALAGLKTGDEIRFKAGVNAASDDAAREFAAILNDGLAKVVAAFDREKGDLPPALAEPLAEALIALNAVQDGSRAYLAMKVPASAAAPELFPLSRRVAVSALDLPQASSASPPQTRSPAESTASVPTATRTATAMASRPAPRTERSSPLANTVPAPVRKLRGWTMDVLNATIAEEPVMGRVVGQAFQADEALIENGVLILRMGTEESPDRVVEIHNVQRIGESLDDKTFESTNVSGVGTPAVFIRWDDPKRLDLSVQRFYNRFAIKLEFDRMRGGRIRGKVFVAVPDGKKSYINGSFDAEVR